VAPVPLGREGGGKEHSQYINIGHDKIHLFLFPLILHTGQERCGVFLATAAGVINGVKVGQRLVELCREEPTIGKEANSCFSPGLSAVHLNVHGYLLAVQEIPQKLVFIGSLFIL
jgi:hypothetical protein